MIASAAVLEVDGIDLLLRNGHLDLSDGLESTTLAARREAARQAHAGQREAEVNFFSQFVPI